MSIDPESERTIDAVAVIRFVRQLLPDENVHISDDLNSELDAYGEQTGHERKQENAGCVLWDLSTIREAASIMAVKAEIHFLG